MSVFPLDESVSQPVAYMHACREPAAQRTPVQQQLVDFLALSEVAQGKIQPVERFAFYERVRGASLIIQTGEATAYGNAMFAKGVILI